MSDEVPATADKPDAELSAQPAVLRATIQITRKTTGKVESFEIVGTPAVDSKEP